MCSGRQVALDISKALMFLHAHNVMHLDLKVSHLRTHDRC